MIVLLFLMLRSEDQLTACLIRTLYHNLLIDLVRSKKNCYLNQTITHCFEREKDDTKLLGY